MLHSCLHCLPWRLRDRGTCRQQCRCTVPKVANTVKKCSWWWANLSPETCRAELKKLINEKDVASCWLLTSWSVFFCFINFLTFPYGRTVLNYEYIEFICNFSTPSLPKLGRQMWYKICSLIAARWNFCKINGLYEHCIGVSLHLKQNRALCFIQPSL